MLTYKVVILSNLLGLTINDASANNRYWLDAGDRAFSRNQLELSIDLYSKAIDNNPVDPVGYIKRSKAYRAQGEYIKSAEDMRRAYNIDPQFVAHYLKNGNHPGGLSQDEIEKNKDS